MITLLAVSIGVAVEHKVTCESPYKWWQGSVIYSVPVCYFRDVDLPLDNVGDMEGLREKLDYVEYMDFKVRLACYWCLVTSNPNEIGDLDDRVPYVL